MRARLLALLLAVALPAVAQENRPGPRERADRAEREARREQRRLSREEQRRLLERFRQLPPEERARLRRLYDEHVRDRSPEELDRLRKKVRDRLPRERAAAEERRRTFEQRPQEE